MTFLHCAFSNVSSNCLHENRHSHIDCICLIFGLWSADLEAILDFAYCGGANIYQHRLDSFLALPEELKLNGLMVDQKINDIKTRVQRPSKLVSQDISSKRLVELNPDIGDDTRREVVEIEGNLKTVEIGQLD